MNNRIISIIGGCGAAGEVVATLLSEQIPNKLFIADIDYEKAEALAKELGKNVQPFKLDVFDENQVREVCQFSNIIVNCAGPTVRILDTVGKIAMNEECDYIEIGGYDYTNDEMRNEINTNSSLSYIISAGWFSGIADYLVYYSDHRADEIFDSKEKLTFFAGDRGQWSDNGLLDTIKFAQQRGTQSMYIANSGKLWKSVNSAKKFSLPFGLGKQRGFLNMTPDLERFALDHSEYNKISGYLILFGWRTYLTLIRIAFLIQSEEKCVQVLKNAYQKEVDKKGKQGIGLVKITGQKNNKRITQWTEIESKEGYFMTGAGCAATVMLLLNRKVKKGFHYMSEAVDIPGFADILKRLEIRISEKIE